MSRSPAWWHIARFAGGRHVELIATDQRSYGPRIRRNGRKAKPLVNEHLPQFLSREAPRFSTRVALTRAAIHPRRSASASARSSIFAARNRRRRFSAPPRKNGFFDACATPRPPGKSGKLLRDTRLSRRSAESAWRASLICGRRAATRAFRRRSQHRIFGAGRDLLRHPRRKDHRLCHRLRRSSQLLGGTGGCSAAAPRVRPCWRRLRDRRRLFSRSRRGHGTQYRGRRSVERVVRLSAHAGIESGTDLQHAGSARCSLLSRVSTDRRPGTGTPVVQSRAVAAPVIRRSGWIRLRRRARTRDALECEFVCIPRPIERATTPDGGPVRYRVVHRAPLWKSSEQPRIERRIVSGHPALSL